MYIYIYMMSIHNSFMGTLWVVSRYARWNMLAALHGVFAMSQMGLWGAQQDSWEESESVGFQGEEGHGIPGSGWPPKRVPMDHWERSPEATNTPHHNNIKPLGGYTKHAKPYPMGVYHMIGNTFLSFWRPSKENSTHCLTNVFFLGVTAAFLTLN